MVRVLDDMQLRFLNRRDWRAVVAAFQSSTALPTIVEALRAGARRLHQPEAGAGTLEPTTR